MIYLDWAASAIPYTDEIEAAYREATAVFANPSAQHRSARCSRRNALFYLRRFRIKQSRTPFIINPSGNRQSCYQQYRTPVGTGTSRCIGALRLDDFKSSFR